MNDLGELKQFAVAHARAQRLGDHARLLSRMHTDDGDAAGSWVAEWSRAGAELEKAGRLLDAAGHYNMARFPFVDGPARQAALERCVSCFGRWAGEHGIEQLELELGGGRVRCWTSGLSPTARQPLLLVCGGIVSIKEQWAPALPMLRRLGVAGVAVEMPGVGENTLGYHEDSWRMLPDLLDALAGQADVEQAYALALSFSGHLALRAAVSDRRIRGVVTVGAPVAEFFSDSSWQARLPRLTVDTLAHLAGAKTAELSRVLAPMALTRAQLASLDIPVAYTASERDEIIPAGEVRLLRETVRNLDVVTHDDVHGSPRHVAETRLWGALSVLRTRGSGGPRYLLLAAALRLLRARARFASSTRRGSPS
ncbi:alpha/beta hydrolase [Amycolatopsis sp. DG1A-15b]|uniref:alpha/beta hydrolase n=1 Tax=Amycolatopsis sp. DG1A-15b TaxID=3052846 RepID=UPI00255C05AF|nr:alpha/beta hydrolase [Amycolatopsis sp. DG1A-15b]WIX91754.1 alpha/beta hydrolase [Amycolatopsis sp. DG1A-15b]